MPIVWGKYFTEEELKTLSRDMNNLTPLDKRALRGFQREVLTKLPSELQKK